MPKKGQSKASQLRRKAIWDKLHREYQVDQAISGRTSYAQANPNYITVHDIFHVETPFISNATTARQRDNSARAQIRLINQAMRDLGNPFFPEAQGEDCFSRQTNTISSLLKLKTIEAYCDKAFLYMDNPNLEIRHIIGNFTKFSIRRWEGDCFIPEWEVDFRDFEQQLTSNRYLNNFVLAFRKDSVIDRIQFSIAFMSSDREDEESSNVTPQDYEWISGKAFPIKISPIAGIKNAVRDLVDQLEAEFRGLDIQDPVSGQPRKGTRFKKDIEEEDVFYYIICISVKFWRTTTFNNIVEKQHRIVRKGQWK